MNWFGFSTKCGHELWHERTRYSSQSIPLQKYQGGHSAPGRMLMPRETAFGKRVTMVEGAKIMRAEPGLPA